MTGFLESASPVAAPTSSALLIGYNPSTTVAAGSNGVNLKTFTAATPGTLNVASAASFKAAAPPPAAATGFAPDVGWLVVTDNASKNHLVGYTGKTSTAFTGCVSIDGLSAVVATSGAVAVTYVNTAGALAGWGLYESAGASSYIARFRDGTSSSATPILATVVVPAGAAGVDGKVFSFVRPIRFEVGLFVEIAGAGGTPQGSIHIL